MDNVVVMAILFLIVILGFAAGKWGYMGGEFDKKLSNIIVDITSPALILSSTMGSQLPDRSLILPLLGISTLSYLLLSAAAFGLPRWITRQRQHHGVIGFALLFGNVGFIGYPVVASIFGHETVFYASILNMVNTLFVFTVGRVLITGGKAMESFQMKVLFSPSMVAAYLAIVIVVCRIDCIPTLISTPMTMVGNVTIPAALMVIGSSISNLPVRTMLGNRIVFTVATLRLLILPALLMMVCLSLGFQPLVVFINTVIIAMPVATYGTIFCLRYGRDVTLMTEMTFITTLLSIATIPLMALLF